ncbi:SDR family NAD(P)-dependent oxidoreductase [Streptomyces sp. NPDC046984]|uniref:SDR family NAD(P)-dependent oxidoreductase n=1 Tax=Streptomyces sp. NPDC046984 TaxID=3155138 RepID=UPI0033CBDAEE
MTAPSLPVDLTGKVALLTGASGGMGQVITARLARLGCHVVVVVRNRESGEQLRGRVAAEIGADRVEVLTADLTSQRDLHQLAEQFTARHSALHLLVNNAGSHFRKRKLNADGVEMHIAIDYLAAFTLTELLLAPLRADTPSRVVNVVSMALEDTRMVRFGRPRPPRIDPAFEDLRHINPAEGWKPLEAYGRAKMLTLMYSLQLADRLRDEKVTVNAVHPGLVKHRHPRRHRTSTSETSPSADPTRPLHTRAGRCRHVEAGHRPGIGRNDGTLLLRGHGHAPSGLRPRHRAATTRLGCERRLYRPS